MIFSGNKIGRIGVTILKKITNFTNLSKLEIDLQYDYILYYNFKILIKVKMIFVMRELLIYLRLLTNFQIFKK